MKKNKSAIRKWMAATLALMLVCMQMMGGGIAASESAELDVIPDEEGYWLDEVDGLVILDDPIYFMNLDESEDAPAEEVDGTEDSAEPAPAETETPGSTSEAQPEATPSAPEETPPQETETPVEPTESPDNPEETPVRPEETPEVPADPPVEEPPVDLKTLFDVEIKAPSAWRNSGTVRVRIKITPSGSQMWQAVQYRIGNGDWKNISEQAFVLYDGYYYTDIEVSANAEFTVRLYGEGDAYFDTARTIRVFDFNAPKVTAGFRELLLHVEASDDLSGVAGIQVNSLLFTTLTDGKLDIRMEDPLNSYKQLAIRAYDYAGNFSEPVTLDNPYYAEPTPTPKPTAKPAAKPTKKPASSSGTSSGSSGKATAMPVVTATPAPTGTPVQQQIVYVTPDPALNVYPAATAAPETVYVPVGPGQPYKSEGNLQTLDMLFSAATNKQFITVQTRSGETYYLIIDYDKPIDEENDIYETYFLNLVDDRDLLAVIGSDELAPTPTPQIVYVTPEPTEVPHATPVPVEGGDKGDMTPVLLLMIAGMAVAGGAAFWFLSKKKKPDREMPDPDDAFDFEDDDETDEE